MRKYYYENVLANENITAKTNVAWVADITEINLDKQRKLYVFLCIDVHTNIVIAQTISRNTLKPHAIVKCFIKAIEKKFRAEPIKKVILHTDRGTQFSSKAYNDFTKHFEMFIIPSMSRESTATDNAIAERFMRTFKQHEINGTIVEQAVQESVLSGEKAFRSIVNDYIKSLNRRPNRESLMKAPKKHDKDVLTASMLLQEPKYPKAFSERFGNDYKREDIKKYKSEVFQVVSILEEFAARKTELVDSTPFDFDDNLLLKLVDDRLKELYALIQNNPLAIS